MRDKLQHLAILTHVISVLSILFLAFLLFSNLGIPLDKVYATNVLTNPSFTGGTTGWTLSTTTYDSSYYQDSAGSIVTQVSGRNTAATGTASQVISSEITGGSTVYLNLYWSKESVDVNCAINTIEIRSTISGNTNTIWQDTYIPQATLGRTSWNPISNQNVSSYFTTTGTYTFQVYMDLKDGNSKNAQCLAWVDSVNLDVTPPLLEVTVGTTGTQTTNIQQGSTDAYMGGAFTFIRNTGSTSVTSITITEMGTISDSNISGLILYYKQEASCSSSIPGDATQFNSTPGSFSSGTSTVTGSMTVGTSQICMYAELDVGSGANVDDTIEIQITNPSTQVSVSAGTVAPSSAVAISGTTTVTILISISLTSDGTVSFGNLSMGTSKSTIDLTDTQVVHNNGSSAIGLNIKTSNATASSPAFLYDYSTNTNDGTPNGTTYLASGKAGGARSFNGSSDYIEVNDHDSLDLTSAGTIEAWIYKVSQTTTPAYVTKGHTQAYQLTEYQNTGRLALKWGSDTETVISDAALPTGEWVHVAGVYDGSKVYLYVNGYEVKNANYTTNAVANNTPVRIGARDDGSYLNGYIDEVHISSIARTPTEILNHFNSVVIQPDVNSVALWHLDETPWALGSSAGTNIFKHEFSSNSGSGWNTFTTADSYQQFVASLAGDTSQNLDLRITVPSSTSDFTQKNISITVQAVSL